MTPEAWTGLYCGPAPLPGELWLRWNLDPALLVALALLAWAVRRSRPGLLGVGVLAVAFVSPLCALSAALFSARVVHHVLLVAIAAPLLAMAWPSRRAFSPAPAFLVSTAVLWSWHWPPAYDLAMSNVAVYWLMQGTLLGSAVVFWRAVLAPAQPAGQALLFVLGGYMQMALLGALLTFAPASLYAIHAFAPLDWGFSPLRDQQLGGLLMWVPAGLPYVVGRHDRAPGLARDRGAAGMIGWLEPIVPHLKALHVGMLALWAAGLFALPRMLSRHDPAIGQADYARIRRATHYGYAFVVTPAAVLAIASGTLLIFVRDAFVLWMFAKLVFVALLVAFHAWLGHTLVHVAETEGEHEPPEPFWPTVLLTVPVVAILTLVLAKPELGEIPVPGWLEEPRGVQLPFDVPRR